MSDLRRPELSALSDSNKLTRVRVRRLRSRPTALASVAGGARATEPARRLRSRPAEPWPAALVPAASVPVPGGGHARRGRAQAEAAPAVEAAPWRSSRPAGWRLQQRPRPCGAHGPAGSRPCGARAPAEAVLGGVTPRRKWRPWRRSEDARMKRMESFNGDFTRFPSETPLARFVPAKRFPSLSSLSLSSQFHVKRLSLSSQFHIKRFFLLTCHLI